MEAFITQAGKGSISVAAACIAMASVLTSCTLIDIRTVESISGVTCVARTLEVSFRVRAGRPSITVMGSQGALVDIKTLQTVPSETKMTGAAM